MKAKDILQIMKEERANVLQELSDAMLKKIILQEMRAVLRENKIRRLKSLINMANQKVSPREAAIALAQLKKMGFENIEAARSFLRAASSPGVDYQKQKTQRPPKQKPRKPRPKTAASPAPPFSKKHAKHSTSPPTPREARKARRDAKRMPPTKRGISDFLKKNPKIRFLLIAGGGLAGFFGAGGAAQASPREYVEKELKDMYQGAVEDPITLIPVVGEIYMALQMLNDKVGQLKGSVKLPKSKIKYDKFGQMKGPGGETGPAPYGGDLL